MSAPVDQGDSREMQELRAERDRYRDALTWIAGADLSGWWGQIARAALYPDRKAA